MTPDYTPVAAEEAREIAEAALRGNFKSTVSATVRQLARAYLALLDERERLRKEVSRTLASAEGFTLPSPLRAQMDRLYAFDGLEAQEVPGTPAAAEEK